MLGGISCSASDDDEGPSAAATTFVFTSRSSLVNTGFNAATGAGVESVDPEERLDLADPTASTLAR